MIVFFVAIFFSSFFLGILEKVNVCKREEEIKVDEDLGNYFDCLSMLHRKQWVLEEINMREQFGIHTIDDEILDKLQKAKLQFR